MVCRASCICLLLAFAINAQPTPYAVEISRASQLLRSVELSDKAWGAYIAAGLHESSLRDQLVSELKNASQYQDAKAFSAEHALVQALLDSLIQMRAAVPLEVIKLFEKRWRYEYFILLAACLEAEAELWRFREKSLPEMEWLAVNNLLLRAKSKRLLEEVVREVHLTHRFKMVGHPRPPGSQVGIVGGTADGPGNIERPAINHFPPEFPPIALYRLTLEPASGNVVLADGPRPVYFRRIVVLAAGTTLRGFGPSFMAGRFNAQSYLLDYIARLTRHSLDTVRQLFERQSTITWVNDPDFRAKANKELDQQVFDIRNFLVREQLFSHGNFTGMKLYISPSVYEDPGPQSGQVPMIGIKEFVMP